MIYIILSKHIRLINHLELMEIALIDHLESKSKKYRHTSPMLTPMFFAGLKKYMMPNIDRIISDTPMDAFDIYNWFNFRTHSVTNLMHFTDQTKRLLLTHGIQIHPTEFPKTQFAIDAQQFYKMYPTFLKTIDENIQKYKTCTYGEAVKYEQIFCKKTSVKLLAEQYCDALKNNNEVKMKSLNMYLSLSSILKMCSSSTQIIEYPSLTVFIINNGQLLFYYFHSGACLWTSPKYKPKTQQYSHLVLNMNSGFNMLKILFTNDKMCLEKLYNKIISTKQLSDDLKQFLTGLCHWLEKTNTSCDEEYNFDIDYSSDAFHNDIVLNNIDQTQLYENVKMLLEMIKSKENITEIIEQLTICKTKYEQFYAKFYDQIDIKKDLQHICQRELVFDDDNYNIISINNKHEVILFSKWAHVILTCSPNKKYFIESCGNLLTENFYQNTIHVFTDTSDKIISVSYELDKFYNDIVCTYDINENTDSHTYNLRYLFCNFKDNFRTCDSFHLSEIAKLFSTVVLDKLEIITPNRKYYNLISSSEKINENNIIGVDIIQNNIVTIKIIAVKDDMLTQSITKIIGHIEETIRTQFDICQIDIIKNHYDIMSCTALESNKLTYSTSDDNTTNVVVITIYFLGGIGRAIKNFFGCMSNTATTSTISYTSNTTDVNLNQNGEDLFDKKNQTIVTNKLNIGTPKKTPNVVWKYAKLKNGTKCIVKLEIPKDAQYVRPISKHIFTENFKERCSKAKVIAIQEYRFDIEVDLPDVIAYSPIDKSKLKYVVGSIVEPDKWDPNPDIVCTHGIHVFSHRQSIINLVNLYNQSSTRLVELPETIAYYKTTKESTEKLNDKLSAPQQSMAKNIISDSDDDD